MMERDMKAVSDGTKTKLEVLETSLRQMRECFLDVSKIFEQSLKAGNLLKLRYLNLRQFVLGINTCMNRLSLSYA